MKKFILPVLFIFGCSGQPPQSRDNAIFTIEDNNHFLMHSIVDDFVTIKLRVRPPYHWVSIDDKFNLDSVGLSGVQREKADNSIPGDAELDVFNILMRKRGRGYRFRADLLDEKGKVIQSYVLIIGPAKLKEDFYHD